jgi:hypothetical protein
MLKNTERKTMLANVVMSLLLDVLLVFAYASIVVIAGWSVLLFSVSPAIVLYKLFDRVPEEERLENNAN